MPTLVTNPDREFRCTLTAQCRIVYLFARPEHRIRIRHWHTHSINPLTPELNSSTQLCLTRFLLGILVLEPCILLTYA
jgi:hypothetical protein